jgi:ADP-ribosylglycohydrolase
VVQELGNGIAAASSCVTAVYLAERFQRRAFGDLMEFVRRCGGDVDTIAAMAGAIWGAANGSARLPAEELARLEQRERLAELAAALWGRATNGDRR